jgi:glucosylglycerate synthase
MPEVDATSQNSQREVAPVDTADIVLGVLSYNNAATIAQVIHNAAQGLAESFPANRSVLVHADGGSKDGTAELALRAAPDRNGLVQVAYPVYPVHLLSPDYHGIPGKGNAVRAVFEIAHKLEAKACAVVDADICELTPQWTEALARPVFEGSFDLVTPHYLRHKYDGTVINGIVYPLVRALYGKRVRQPIGADFGYSAKLVTHLMLVPWDPEATGAGVDAWITMQSIAGGFKLAQAALGRRVQNQSGPPPQLSTALAQVLGSLFTEIQRTAPVWQRARTSEAVPILGSNLHKAPEPPVIDVQPLIDSFRLGFQNLREIWSEVLPPATLLDLKKLASQPDATFRFTDSTWARTVYDFALAHRMRVMDSNHLLQAITPLYLGWVASYVLQVRNASAMEVEQCIEALCRTFETQKGYFIARWRWPDKFNP